MVVFTCGHCGEAVNKPKVEKHYLTKCRNRPPNLSCMDCFKDFFGKDYEAHTKCISEAQRYAAKGFVPKVNKGEAKQSAWVEMVQGVLEEQKNAPRHVLRIVEEISKHTNTPRKKPKFFNFVKNICGPKTMPKDIEAAWDLISVKLSALSNANNQNDKPNGVDKEENSNGIASEATEMKEKTSVENSDTDEKAESKEVKTKKQRKEEKKRKKYEAELQSAAVQPTEETVKDETNISKKDKKKKQTEQENTLDIAEEEKVHKKAKKRKNSEQNGEKTADKEIHQPAEQNGGKPKNKKCKATEEAQENGEVPSLHDLNIASEEPPKVKSEKFDWEGTIVSLLQKKGGEMPFKRLQKKVLAEYAEVSGQETDDRIAEKLNKKLRSAANVRVEKNRVLLVD